MAQETKTKAKMVNGVNVDQLSDTIEQIKARPELAQFQFRATNAWSEGTHTRATIKDFYGAMRLDTSRQPMTFEMDEPPILCGNNLGANPVEYLLAALSGCVTTTIVAHAAAKGIEIRGVRSRYEGDIDLQGFLGLKDDVPVGYKEIRIFFQLDADVPDAQKEELVRMGQKFSPVYNTIAKGARVSVRLEK